MALKSRTDILTDDERMAWKDRDPEAFWEWFTRMNHVEFDEVDNELKHLDRHVPRHRYNKKNPRLP